MRKHDVELSWLPGGIIVCTGGSGVAVRGIIGIFEYAFCPRQCINCPCGV